MTSFALAPLLWTVRAEAAGFKTDPNDVVSITNTAYKNGSAVPVFDKKYKKKWKDIVLDSKTKRSIGALLTYVEAFKEYSSVFRVAHLRIVNNDVQRVLLVSDDGSAIALEMGKPGTYCYATTFGNGFLTGDCQGDMPGAS